MNNTNQSNSTSPYVLAFNTFELVCDDLASKAREQMSADGSPADQHESISEASQANYKELKSKMLGLKAKFKNDMRKLFGELTTHYQEIIRHSRFSPEGMEHRLQIVEKYSLMAKRMARRIVQEYYPGFEASPLPRKLVWGMRNVTLMLCHGELSSSELDSALFLTVDPENPLHPSYLGKEAEAALKKSPQIAQQLLAKIELADKQGRLAGDILDSADDYIQRLNKMLIFHGIDSVENSDFAYDFCQANTRWTAEIYGFDLI